VNDRVRVAVELSPWDDRENPEIHERYEVVRLRAYWGRDSAERKLSR
jgi:hypothetical protein